MSLRVEFDQSAYIAAKASENVLRIASDALYFDYDFAARIMTARTGRGDGGVSVTPFSQLDRETLIEFRDKLVALGGHPPELPPEPAAQNNPAQKLKL